MCIWDVVEVHSDRESVDDRIRLGILKRVCSLSHSCLCCRVVVMIVVLSCTVNYVK